MLGSPTTETVVPETSTPLSTIKKSLAIQSHATASFQETPWDESTTDLSKPVVPMSPAVTSLLSQAVKLEDVNMDIKPSAVEGASMQELPMAMMDPLSLDPQAAMMHMMMMPPQLVMGTPFHKPLPKNGIQTPSIPKLTSSLPPFKTPAPLVKQGLQQSNPSSSSSSLPPPWMPKTQLLPFKNEYAIRMNQGETSMVHPLKRKKMAESDNEEEFEEYDQEDQDQMVSRHVTVRKRAGVKQALQATANGTSVRRVMKRTKHGFLLVNSLYPSSSRYRQQIEQISDCTELLVPIRVELELDGTILRDTFTWNLNERHITPEKFAELLCDDLDIPMNLYVPLISNSIRAQIQDYSAYFLEADIPVFPDSRVILNLDFSIGRLQIKDKFEWDMSSDLTPEEFAQVLTSDLGLGGEYVTMIAHSIHEQLLRNKMDDDFETLRPLPNGFRDEKDVEDWAPTVEYLNEDDMDRMKVDNERNARRLRRESKAGSVNLLSRRKSYLSYETPGGSRGLRMRHLMAQDNVKMTEEERDKWHCSHCKVRRRMGIYDECSGIVTSCIREGPGGPQDLCNSCGLYYIVNESLPDHRRDLFLPFLQ